MHFPVLIGSPNFHFPRGKSLEIYTKGKTPQRVDAERKTKDVILPREQSLKRRTFQYFSRTTQKETHTHLKQGCFKRQITWVFTTQNVTTHAFVHTVTWDRRRFIGVKCVVDV